MKPSFLALAAALVLALPLWWRASAAIEAPPRSRIAGPPAAEIPVTATPPILSFKMNIDE